MLKDKILVIPGTEAQIPLICKLKKLDYYVVNINPIKESPAFQYADICIQGDILDKQFCLKVAKKYDVIAVLSDQCDIAIPTITYISEVLELPSIGAKLAELYTNKYKMRVFCQSMDMPYPNFKKCYTEEDAILFFNSLERKKMVMKPLDSNSSRGVATITSEKMIKKHFSQSIVFSKADSAVLCEEYIEGTEFTVEGIVINGKHYSIAISKKKHYEYNPNIACELYFSQSDGIFDYEQLRFQNNKYVELSKLPFGFTHAEYKFDGSNYILIEIGARGGGNFISSHIVPNLVEVDLYNIFLNNLLGKSNVVAEHFNHKLLEKYAILKFFDVSINRGKVLDIIGEEILKESSLVILYQFRFKIGDVIQKAQNDSLRVGFYIAVSEDKDKLDELINNIQENVYIKLEEI